MRAKIIQIGNSQGIRIPKPVLRQARITSEVDIEVAGGKLIVLPVRPVRDGWDESFCEMHERGDDSLVDGDRARPTEWDNTEWEW